MIKIFKKQRQDHMEKKKTGTYLKYVVGEVILVVIGILIAVQINNWNESRKLKNTISTVYSIIKSDLQTDIKSIDDIMVSYDAREPVFKSVLSNTMTFEAYKKCNQCFAVISGYPDLGLKTRGLKLLEENSTLFDVQKDSLIININSFYSLYNTELDVAMREMETDFSNNYLYWKNNKPWFNDFYRINETPSNTDDLINYFLTSDYRNRVGSFYLLHYKIYLTHLKGYKTNALKIIEAIDQKLK